MKILFFKIKLVVFLCFAFSFFAKGQTFPVQLTGNLMPPNSLDLSVYKNSRSNDIMFTATLLDPTKDALQVKLKLYIETFSGALYETDPNFSGPTITLERGIPFQINGNTLSPYLTPQALIGLSASSTGAIEVPSGFNRVCVEVIGVSRVVPVSGKTCAGGSFDLNLTPELIFPNCNSQMEYVDNQNIVFTWNPRHLASSNSPGMVEYEFELKKLPSGNYNPNDVFQSAATVASATVSTNSFTFLNGSQITLDKNAAYAWRVRAKSVMYPNSKLFQNKGYSEICAFAFEGTPLNEYGVFASAPQGCEVFSTQYSGEIKVASATSTIVSQDKVRVGYFDMTIVEATRAGDSYSGTGYIGIPMIKAKVRTSFSGLKVNERLQVYQVDRLAAICNTPYNISVENSNLPGLKAVINQQYMTNIESAFSLPLYGDMKVSMFDYANATPVNLPIMLDGDPDQPVYLVGINFTKNNAALTLASSIKKEGHQDIIFAGNFVEATPNGIKSDSYLDLLNEADDIPYQNVTPQFQLSSTGEADLKIDCNGFKSYEATESLIINPDKVKNENDEAIALIPTSNTNQLSTYSGKVKKFGTFKIMDIPQYTFKNKSKPTLDLSTSDNPITIDDYMASSFPNWRGMLLDDVELTFTEVLKLPSKKEVSKLEDGLMIFNESSASYGVFKKKNILKLEEGRFDNWAVSIDRFTQTIKNGKAEEPELRGELMTPIFTNILDYKGRLTLSDYAVPQLPVFLPKGRVLNMDLWKANFVADQGSEVNLSLKQFGDEKSFYPKSNISGNLSINLTKKVVRASLKGDIAEKEIFIQTELGIEDYSFDLSGLHLSEFKIDPYNLPNYRYTLQKASTALVKFKIGDKDINVSNARITHVTDDGDGKESLDLILSATLDKKSFDIYFIAKSDGERFVFDQIDIKIIDVDCECTAYLDEVDEKAKWGVIIEQFVKESIAFEDGKSAYNGSLLSNPIEDESTSSYVKLLTSYYMNNNLSGFPLIAIDRIKIPALDRELIVERRGDVYIGKNVIPDKRQLSFENLKLVQDGTLPIDISDQMLDLDFKKSNLPPNAKLLITAFENNSKEIQSNSKIELTILYKLGHNNYAYFTVNDIEFTASSIKAENLKLDLGRNAYQGESQEVVFKKEGSFAKLDCTNGFTGFEIEGKYIFNESHLKKSDDKTEIEFLLREDFSLTNFIAPLKTTNSNKKTWSFNLRDIPQLTFQSDNQTESNAYLDFHVNKSVDGFEQMDYTPNDLGSAYKGLVFKSMAFSLTGFEDLTLIAQNSLYSQEYGFNSKYESKKQLISRSERKTFAEWMFELDALKYSISNNIISNKGVEIDGSTLVPIFDENPNQDVYNFESGWIKFQGSIIFAEKLIIQTQVKDFQNKVYQAAFMPNLGIRVDIGSFINFSYVLTEKEFEASTSLSGAAFIDFGNGSGGKFSDISFRLPNLYFNGLSVNMENDACNTSVKGMKSLNFGNWGLLPQNDALSTFLPGFQDFPLTVHPPVITCDDQLFKLSIGVSVQLKSDRNDDSKINSESNSNGSTTTSNNSKVDDWSNAYPGMPNASSTDVARNPNGTGLSQTSGTGNTNRRKSKSNMFFKSAKTASLEAGGTVHFVFEGKDDDWKFKDFELGCLYVAGGFGPIDIKGGLNIFRSETGEALYGRGFKAYADVTILERFNVKAVGQFGVKQVTDETTNEKSSFRYFFIDLEGSMEMGIPIPSMEYISLYGGGGGFRYNMRLKSQTEQNKYSEPASNNDNCTIPDEYLKAGTTLTSSEFLPEKDNYGANIGVIAGLTAPHLLIAKVGLDIGISANSNGLAFETIKIMGEGDMLYESVVERKNSIFNIESGITFDFKTKILSGYIGYSALLSVPVLGDILTAPSSGEGYNKGSLFIDFTSRDWNIKFGSWGSTNDGQIRPNISPPSGLNYLSHKLNIPIINFSREIDGYFQFGSNVDPFPPLAYLIPNWDEDEPERSNRSVENNAFKTGLGIAAGLRFKYSVNPSFGPFSGLLSAGFGGDFSLRRYEGVVCNGSTLNIGMAGWYAKGQAYAYVNGGVFIEASTAFGSGKYEVFSGSAALAVQAFLPNPSYIRGELQFRYDVCGGLVSGEVNLGLEFGDKAQIECVASLAPPVPSIGRRIVTAVTPEGVGAQVMTDVTIITEISLKDYLPRPIYNEEGNLVKTEKYQPRMDNVVIKHLKTGKVIGYDSKMEKNGYGYFLKLKEILLPNEEYSIYYKFVWYKDNVPYDPGPDGGTCCEERTITFTTGAYPDEIDRGMLTSQCPGYKQRYWHKDYAVPLMRFKEGLKINEYFAPTTTIQGKEYKNEFIASITTFDGAGNPGFSAIIPVPTVPDSKSVPKYIISKKQIGANFFIPSIDTLSEGVREVIYPGLNDLDLKKRFLSRIQIIRRPILPDFEVESELVAAGEGINIRKPKIDASILNEITKNTKIIYENYFGVSKFDKLVDKINASSITAFRSKIKRNDLEHPLVNMVEPGKDTDPKYAVEDLYFGFDAPEEGYDKYDAERILLNSYSKNKYEVHSILSEVGGATTSIFSSANYPRIMAAIAKYTSRADAIYYRKMLKPLYQENLRSFNKEFAWTTRTSLNPEAIKNIDLLTNSEITSKRILNRNLSSRRDDNYVKNVFSSQKTYDLLFRDSRLRIEFNRLRLLNKLLDIEFKVRMAQANLEPYALDSDPDNMFLLNTWANSEFKSYYLESWHGSGNGGPQKIYKPTDKPYINPIPDAVNNYEGTFSIFYDNKWKEMQSKLSNLETALYPSWHFTYGAMEVGNDNISNSGNGSSGSHLLIENNKFELSNYTFGDDVYRIAIYEIENGQKKLKSYWSKSVGKNALLLEKSTNNYQISNIKKLNFPPLNESTASIDLRKLYPNIGYKNKLIAVEVSCKKLSKQNLSFISNGTNGKFYPKSSSAFKNDISFPYNNFPIEIPGQINLEEFDWGGPGVSHHVYRSMADLPTSGFRKYEPIQNANELGNYIILNGSKHVKYSILPRHAGKYVFTIVHNTTRDDANLVVTFGDIVKSVKLKNTEGQVGTDNFELDFGADQKNTSILKMSTNSMETKLYDLIVGYPIEGLGILGSDFEQKSFLIKYDITNRYLKNDNQSKTGIINPKSDMSNHLFSFEKIAGDFNKAKWQIKNKSSQNSCLNIAGNGVEWGPCTESGAQWELFTEDKGKNFKLKTKVSGVDKYLQPDLFGEGLELGDDDNSGMFNLIEESKLDKTPGKAIGQIEDKAWYNMKYLASGLYAQSNLEGLSQTVQDTNENRQIWTFLKEVKNQKEYLKISDGNFRCITKTSNGMACLPCDEVSAQWHMVYVEEERSHALFLEEGGQRYYLNLTNGFANNQMTLSEEWDPKSKFVYQKVERKTYDYDEKWVTFEAGIDGLTFNYDDGKIKLQDSDENSSKQVWKLESVSTDSKLYTISNRYDQCILLSNGELQFGDCNNTDAQWTVRQQGKDKGVIIEKNAGAAVFNFADMSLGSAVTAGDNYVGNDNIICTILDVIPIPDDISENWYRIKDLGLEKYFEVTSVEGKLKELDLYENDQIWNFAKFNDAFHIKDRFNNCLVLSSGKVKSEPCSNNSTTWSIEPTGYDQYNLESESSPIGKKISTLSGSNELVAIASQTPFSFSLEKCQPQVLPNTIDGWFTLSVPETNLFLDMDDGAFKLLDKDIEENNQLWHISEIGGNNSETFNIKNERDECLNINGGELTLGTCTDNDGSWTLFTQGSTNAIGIKHISENKILGVENNTSGAKMNLLKVDNDLDRFMLTEIQKPEVIQYSGWYRLQDQNEDNYLDISRVDSKLNPLNEEENNQIFKIEKFDGFDQNFYEIRNEENRCLIVENNTVKYGECLQELSRWQIYTQGQTEKVGIRYKKTDGTYLTLRKGTEDSDVVSVFGSKSDLGRFTIHSIEKPKLPELSGWYRINMDKAKENTINGMLKEVGYLQNENADEFTMDLFNEKMNGQMWYIEKYVDEAVPYWKIMNHYDKCMVYGDKLDFGDCKSDQSKWELHTQGTSSKIGLRTMDDTRKILHSKTEVIKSIFELSDFSTNTDAFNILEAPRPMFVKDNPTNLYGLHLYTPAYSISGAIAIHGHSTPSDWGWEQNHTSYSNSGGYRKKHIWNIIPSENQEGKWNILNINEDRCLFAEENTLKLADVNSNCSDWEFFSYGTTENYAIRVKTLDGYKFISFHQIDKLESQDNVVDRFDIVKVAPPIPLPEDSYIENNWFNLEAANGLQLTGEAKVVYSEASNTSSQQWGFNRYRNDWNYRLIVNRATGYCLRDDLQMQPCDNEDDKFKWKFESTDEYKKVKLKAKNGTYLGQNSNSEDVNYLRNPEDRDASTINFEEDLTGNYFIKALYTNEYFVEDATVYTAHNITNIKGISTKPTTPDGVWTLQRHFENNEFYYTIKNFKGNYLSDKSNGTSNYPLMSGDYISKWKIKKSDDNKLIFINYTYRDRIIAKKYNNGLYYTNDVGSMTRAEREEFKLDIEVVENVPIRQDIIDGDYFVIKNKSTGKVLTPTGEVIIVQDHNPTSSGQLWQFIGADNVKQVLNKRNSNYLEEYVSNNSNLLRLGSKPNASYLIIKHLTYDDIKLTSKITNALGVEEGIVKKVNIDDPGTVWTLEKVNPLPKMPKPIEEIIGKWITIKNGNEYLTFNDNGSLYWDERIYGSKQQIFKIDQFGPEVNLNKLKTVYNHCVDLRNSKIVTDCEPTNLNFYISLEDDNLISLNNIDPKLNQTVQFNATTAKFTFEELDLDNLYKFEPYFKGSAKMYIPEHYTSQDHRIKFINADQYFDIANQQLVTNDFIPDATTQGFRMELKEKNEATFVILKSGDQCLVDTPDGPQFKDCAGNPFLLDFEEVAKGMFTLSYFTGTERKYISFNEGVISFTTKISNYYQLELVETGNFTSTVNPGEYFISNKVLKNWGTYSDRTLNNLIFMTTGTGISGMPYNDSESQKMTVENTDKPNIFFLKNESGKCLEYVTGGWKGFSFNVCNDNSNNQKWMLQNLPDPNKGFVSIKNMKGGFLELSQLRPYIIVYDFASTLENSSMFQMNSTSADIQSVIIDVKKKSGNFAIDEPKHKHNPGRIRFYQTDKYLQSFENPSALGVGDFEHTNRNQIVSIEKLEVNGIKKVKLKLGQINETYFYEWEGDDPDEIGSNLFSLYKINNGVRTYLKLENDAIVWAEGRTGNFRLQSQKSYNFEYNYLPEEMFLQNVKLSLPSIDKFLTHEGNKIVFQSTDENNKNRIFDLDKFIFNNKTLIQIKKDGLCLNQSLNYASCDDNETIFEISSSGNGNYEISYFDGDDRNYLKLDNNALKFSPDPTGAYRFKIEEYVGDAIIENGSYRIRSKDRLLDTKYTNHFYLEAETGALKDVKGKVLDVANTNQIWTLESTGSAHEYFVKDKDGLCLATSGLKRKPCDSENILNKWLIQPCAKPDQGYVNIRLKSPNSGSPSLRLNNYGKVDITSNSSDQLIKLKLIPNK